MRKIYLFLILMTSGYLTHAQVKIGDNLTNVNASSALEIESTNKGLLFPRVALTSTTSPSPLTSFVAGMTVYNTATAGTGTTAVSPGLYFSDGTKWLAAVAATVPDATSTVKGIVQLAGDLTGTAAAPAVANNAITSAKIADGTIVTADFADNAVTSAKIVDATVANADLAIGVGGIYKGSGLLSGNTTVTMGTNTLNFSSTATAGTSHFSIDGTTLNVDAVNNRVGIGTSAPGARFELSSGTAGSSGLRFSNINSSTTLTTSGISTLGVNSNGDVVVVPGKSTYESGDIVQVKVFSGSEITGTYNVNFINGTFTIPSFTPKSNNSTILIEADGTYYVTGFSDAVNGGVDHYALQVRQGSTILMDKRQVWNLNGGAGTRSSVLFPVMARFSNTSTAAKSFNLTANRISGDDSINFSNNIVVKITEIQN